MSWKGFKKLKGFSEYLTGQDIYDLGAASIKEEIAKAAGVASSRVHDSVVSGVAAAEDDENRIYLTPPGRLGWMDSKAAAAVADDFNEKIREIEKISQKERIEKAVFDTAMTIVKDVMEKNADKMNEAIFKNIEEIVKTYLKKDPDYLDLKSRKFTDELEKMRDDI